MKIIVDIDTKITQEIEDNQIVFYCSGGGIVRDGDTRADAIEMWEEAMEIAIEEACKSWKIKEKVL